ncbi:MAG: alpha-glucan family phosphorylase [Bacteroidales bacterium]|nr:alpha-glucan family phosphorylase [Bacteroidales bacterium]
MATRRKELLQPDYLFEVSWEVCNKVGGIYTVVATKALHLSSQLGRRHIFIGPDVWMHRSDNPDFLEDPMLYRSWKAQALTEGLRFRVGRWNIPGRPVAILVDYKQFLTQADDILGALWNDFGVDSISGNWDYKESAVFGVIAGRVIESFWNYNLKGGEKVVAQFHEWQTGAGILHLRKAQIPIATAFTTHATMMGRCLAGNNLPLYDNIAQYNGDEMARRFNVTAIYSLEKKSAQNADVFTTVSDITAKECAQFLERPVDVVTPNGFENSFTPSSDAAYDTLHKAARERLVKVASAMSAEAVPENSIFIGIGGRYEFRNKGIDVFIDALDKLNREGFEGRPVQAFIMIPSGHHGPDKELVAKLEGRGDEHYQTQTSHYLMNAEYDTITRRLRETGLVNSIGDKVKVYFIPSYLTGEDGVFNMPYYDILCGLDLALFPSYYEPWGYTPLEALAFRIPTLTTDLAGFGLWVETHYKKEHPGITVLHRDETNYGEVVDGVAQRVREIANLDKAQRKAYRENAREVAQIALWENQIIYYKEAYSLALEKVQARKDSYKSKDKTMQYFKSDVTSPSWRSIIVTRHLPEKLSRLEKLSKNLWWCWNESAKDLFRSIDPEIWHKSGHNPLAVLDTVSIKRFQQLSEDPEFLARMRRVLDEFDTYMAAKAKRKDPSIAYFCMEYGLDTSLKIYSGGLGILAGDYLKETSDMNVNLVAVGLLYRYGYFNQVLSAQGYQVAGYDAQDFTKIPAVPVLDKDGNWVTTSVAFPGRNLTARLWKVEVGRTDLYLMDTDYEANIPEDREVTYHLYGGNWENRLKQELLLGVGGIRALRKIGLDPQVYHCNEGHAAFIGMERLREYIEKDNLDFTEALEVVRASSLFTTHTPVPAGHDAFDEGLLRQYIGHYPERLKVDWETLMSLGKDNPLDPHEKFSMSNLAANISQNVNGVSMLHGKVSQEIFQHMYQGYLPEELFVSYVTNGVHYPTWCAPEWKPVHARVFGPAFATHHYDKSCFDGIYGVSDAEVWGVKSILKSKLIKFLRERLSDSSISNHYSPSELVTIMDNLRDDVLTIGFARRFATYKRATLLFRDLDRLDKIVNNPTQPVQFLFAGKAHPADKAGQDLIKQIVDISKDPRFIGKIVFVPGYDITLAKRMVQGVDVWMNNPTRPQEASGTSGEKAAMNGTMHFSVLDGWWVEGYREGAGWALPIEQAYEDNNFQNELDAATIYQIIENDIAPAYYNVDRMTGRSSEWIGYIKNTIAKVACNFTTNRMLTDYMNQYYEPQSKAVAAVKAKDFAKARELAAWKTHVRREWENVRLVSRSQPDTTYDLSVAQPYHAEMDIQLGDLTAKEVGLEIVFAQSDARGKVHIVDVQEFKVVSVKDGVAHYAVDVLPEKTGSYLVGARVFAKHPLLAHRQSFECVKWL